MLNSYNANGRLTRDPVLRVTSNNIEVVNFNMAVDRNFTNADGKYECDYIPCVAYKKTAQLLSKHIHKGDLIGIQGRIQTRNYDDKDGKKVYVTEVVVDRFDFLNVKKVGTNEPTVPGVDTTQLNDFTEEYWEDDSLPF